MGELTAEAREGLAYALSCSQCGRSYSEPACGPTHAILAVQPERHRLVAPLIEEALAARRESLAERVRALADEWAAEGYPKGVRCWCEFCSGYSEAADRLRALLDEVRS